LLQPQVLDLNRLVAEVEERLRGVIGEGIELATMLQPEIAKVRADPDQMEHVLLSLAANAREAMPPGGRLTIETADVELDQSWAAHTPDCKPGPHVLLAVSDTGAGMDAATQARIFEPFFTTKPVGQGSGLGLATVYGIVSQSGGHIDFSSEAGRGTTFRIYLPRCEALVEPCVPAVSEPGLREGSATVLVVEDEEALRELAREFLESSGYRVLDSPNGAAALELARQYPGPIHLVLTDVIMPEMNGREMADRMAAVRPDARILFMSGYTGDAIAPFEIVDSGRRFLQKPFTRAELLEKMRELLGRETDA
jgi:CheY-like chemotaxis protein